MATKNLKPTFKEPEQCLECDSDAPMTFRYVSKNDGPMEMGAWLCDDCGHAHLSPEHDEDDCAGC